MSIDEIFAKIVEDSADTREQGTRFERAVEFFLRNDPSWSEHIEDVWMWDDAPTNHGKQDTGIDLVAKDTDGSYWAIQAKCYNKTLGERDVSTFFMNASADDTYGHLMLADTAPSYTSNLEDFSLNFILSSSKDLVRLDLDTMRDANLDWNAFMNGETPANRTVFDPRPHQREAIDKVSKELSTADRCSLVMACGTGKTLTALRFTEEFVGNGGTVLYLAPSISLVSQSMRDWVNQVRGKIHVYVVCSDHRASEVKQDESYGSLTDIPFPATTNAHTVAERFHREDGALNVIFSTYQSIDVIHEAQEEGLFDFDLTICDEAHRTTGVMDGEAAFQKVHDSEFIRSAKRLYMTATPRIFDQGAKNKAVQGAVEIASMDDPDTYGNIAYRLSFGKAVDMDLLTDYKIVVMQVAENMMSSTMQQHYGKGAGSELELDDAMKFVGCWKALFDRRHAQGVSDLIENSETGADSEVADTQPHDDAKRVLHHAIAFAPSIKASKALTNKFRAVIADYTKSLEPTAENAGMIEAGKQVQVEIDHVDGGMDSQTRHRKLDWLARDTADNECHILSNARCLAEGIDVPDLDAVMYLSARRSRVDIIQSVGRVMRKAPGKEYGYIIIPVVVPMGADPDTVLSSGAYDTVWEVVRALRSHDERLDAVINAAALGDTDSLKRIVEVEVLDQTKLRLHKKPKANNVPPIGSNVDPGEFDGHDGEDTGSSSSSGAMQPEFDLVSSEMARNINAEIVRRCGTKMYWGEWTDDIASIAKHRITQITDLVNTGAARESFTAFAQGLRDSLNPGYKDEDAIAVLAQHEITKPIFQTLFTNKEVLEGNPIVRGLDRALDSLYEAGLPKAIDNPTLNDLYSSVRLSASQVQSDAAKQNLIKEIYNEFFTKAFKDTADSLGIVYTPVEVVDAQLHMVQRALQHEFGQSLGDRNVHILDGFAGTGTYICRLIEDQTLISDRDLPYKYAHDLHSNEIVPLAATIMDINIEQSYHKRMGGDYQPFPGALLTDTFQMHEEGDTLDDTMFTENTQRVRQQMDLPIRIIIGNPPYRAGDSDNTGNQNTKYPSLDQRIEQTYAIGSDANNNNSLYDHYIRAFRWASDRIGDSGIVCFVSNGGWLTGNSGAGVRRCFSSEFNTIHVYNLRGNARTQGEQRRKEKDNVFGAGTRTTITITMLVKNPTSNEHGAIYYHNIGDYLSRETKLNILKDCTTADPEWNRLEQDKHGDWLNHRDDSYTQFIPMGIQDGSKKLPTGLFKTWSRGIQSGRDAWAYNFSYNQVVNSMNDTIDYYNQQLTLQNNTEPGKNKSSYINDNPHINWTRGFRQSFAKGNQINKRLGNVITAIYRPFCKQFLWFDRQTNEMIYQQPKLFPYAEVMNFEICLPKGRDSYPIMAQFMPDIQLQFNGQYFPLNWYEDSGKENINLLTGLNSANADSHGYIRHDAITNAGLKVFREAYPHTKITKEDIFYYVYGILHSPEYRERFGNNLKKELPRIPLAKDFKAFMKAGRELAHLHLDYETIDHWPVHEIGDSMDPGRTEKMTYPKKVKDSESGKKVPDMTVLQVAENLTIEGIPMRAYDYVVNGKSAIGWLIDRYRVTTDKKSGIVNDPNEYSDDPRYIADLVESVITVSMNTLDIVETLPALEELPQPANWPAEWRS